MAEATVRVGLVGVGRWGSKIARTLERLAGVEVAALCDRSFLRQASSSSESLSGAWAKYPQYAELEPLLADPTIDAVVIATPPDQHHRMTSKALRAAKHVLVEKPMALSVAQAEELSELAATAGRVLMVGHLLHYHPAIARIFEHLRQGDIGRPLAFLSERANVGTSSRGDVWWTLAPHDVSLSRRAFQADPSAVSARASGTSVTAVLRFPEGMARLRVAYAAPKRVRRLALIGTRRTVFFDDAHAPPILTWAPTTASQLEELRSVNAEAWCWERLMAGASRLERLGVAGDEPLASELLHFAACIRERHKPLTDAAEGLAVTRVMVAGQQSIEIDGLGAALTGGRSHLDRFGADSPNQALELS